MFKVNRSVGAALIHADRRTDMTKVMGAFLATMQTRLKCLFIIYYFLSNFKPIYYV